MGFNEVCIGNRVRINLSETATLILEEDRMRFDVEKRSTFFNILFHNFYEQARSSVTIYLEYKKEELKENLKDCPMEEAMRKKIIAQLLSHEADELREMIRRQSKNKHSSEIYRINVENMKYLTGEDCHEEEADKYNGKLSLYLKCILEEYAALPYIKREQIFFKDKYEIIQKAIRTESRLKIEVNIGMKFYVYPYSLETDPFSTRTYLTCLSRRIDVPDSVKTPASFIIPRMKSVKVMRQSGHLTKAEKEEVKTAIQKRTAQFLLGEDEEIRVRLTENGVYKYRTKIYLRPSFDADLSHDDIYVFHCTRRQAEYYFFQFGEDAEILSPANLRAYFAALYGKASAHYQEK